MEPLSIILCGPSGVGKTTIVQMLLKDFPSKVGFAVSHTSRKPRNGETDGVSYHFVDKLVLQNDISNGPIKFLEHSEVHSNLYGTRLDSLECIYHSGKLCISEMDIKGVQQVKAHSFPAKFIFLAPPSMECLESRLRRRGTDSEEQIVLRLSNAVGEMTFGTAENNFDEVIVNDELEVAYEEVLRHLREWFPVVGL